MQELKREYRCKIKKQQKARKSRILTAVIDMSDDLKKTETVVQKNQVRQTRETKFQY